jgi:hypothetical protein
VSFPNNDFNANSSRSKLFTFLLGTVQKDCPLRSLRGQGDILRIIWTLACSEWWTLHIQRYSIPKSMSESQEDAEVADINMRTMFVERN